MATEEKQRHILARIFAILAFALLFFAYLLVAICLICAARDGVLSDLWAPPSGGNHGPWRHYPPARNYLDSSPLFVPLAAILAMVSASLEPKRLPIFVLLGCAAFTFNYVLFFWMMTD